MDNDKNLEYEEGAEEHEEDVEHAPRARNRTVMLTPEITGQVRARLAKELDYSRSGTGSSEDEGAPPPPEKEPARSAGGFVSVARRTAPEAAAAGESRTRGIGGHSAPTARESEVSPPEKNARRPEKPQRESAPPPRPAAPAIQGSGDLLEWKKVSPLVGFLVTFDLDPNGEVYPLRSGRLIVTSEMPSGGNFLFLVDDTVSSMHAIVRIGDGGEIQVLDQLSEHGTLVKRLDGSEEVRLSGDKCEVYHGDELCFGNRKFLVSIMPKRH